MFRDAIMTSESDKTQLTELLAKLSTANAGSMDVLEAALEEIRLRDHHHEALPDMFKTSKPQEGYEKKDNPVDIMYMEFNRQIRVLLNTLRQKYPKDKQSMFDKIHRELDVAIENSAKIPYQMWKENTAGEFQACMKEYTPENGEYFFKTASKISLLKMLRLEKYSCLFREEDRKLLWKQLISIHQITSMLTMFPEETLRKITDAVHYTVHNTNTFDGIDEQGNGADIMASVLPFVTNLLTDQSIKDAVLKIHQSIARPPEEDADPVKASKENADRVIFSTM